MCGEEIGVKASFVVACAVDIDDSGELSVVCVSVENDVDVMIFDGLL